MIALHDLSAHELDDINRLCRDAAAIGMTADQ